MPLSLKDHWNKKYTDTPITQLGWYESKSVPSLQLIENCAVSKDAAILDVGSGVSVLIANLLELGYHNLYAVDISQVALDKAQALLTPQQATQAHWIIDDITNPTHLLEVPPMLVWHDRAVLHFLIEEQPRETYRTLLKKLVIPGGFVILAAFALHGASKCSGLPVQRYSVESLTEFVGPTCKLVESLEHAYHTPSGELRPYIYTRFQKI